MKKTISSILILGTIALAAPASAGGAVERACRQSDRSAATPQLCACIQTVADATFTRSEHRRVAKFFKDPHKAQQVRQSDRRSDAEFWRKYRSFGERAQLICG